MTPPSTWTWSYVIKCTFPGYFHPQCECCIKRSEAEEGGRGGSCAGVALALSLHLEMADHDKLHEQKSKGTGMYLLVHKCMQRVSECVSEWVSEWVSVCICVFVCLFILTCIGFLTLRWLLHLTTTLSTAMNTPPFSQHTHQHPSTSGQQSGAPLGRSSPCRGYPPYHVLGELCFLSYFDLVLIWCLILDR